MPSVYVDLNKLVSGTGSKVDPYGRDDNWLGVPAGYSVYVKGHATYASYTRTSDVLSIFAWVPNEPYRLKFDFLNFPGSDWYEGIIIVGYGKIHRTRDCWWEITSGNLSTVDYPTERTVINLRNGSTWTQNAGDGFLNSTIFGANGSVDLGNQAGGELKDVATNAASFTDLITTPSTDYTVTGTNLFNREWVASPNWLETDLKLFAQGSPDEYIPIWARSAAYIIRVIDPAKVIQLIGEDTTVIIANNVSEGFIPRPSSSSSEGINR